MEDVLTELYEVVTQRHENPQEGSYTCYLFDQGLDKILKKVGEESAETIIAAKNGIKEDTVGEISDLLWAAPFRRGRRCCETAASAILPPLTG